MSKTSSGVPWSGDGGGNGIMLLLCLALALMTIGQCFAAPSTNGSGTNGTILAYNSNQSLHDIQRAAENAMTMGFAKDNDSFFLHYDFFSESDAETKAEAKMKQWQHENWESFAVLHPEWKFTKALYGLYKACLVTVEQCLEGDSACTRQNACDEAFDATNEAQMAARAVMAMYYWLKSPVTVVICAMDADPRCEGFKSTVPGGETCESNVEECYNRYLQSCGEKVLTASSKFRFACTGSVLLDSCTGSFDDKCTARKKACISGIWYMIENWHFCNELKSDPCDDDNEPSNMCTNYLPAFREDVGDLFSIDSMKNMLTEQMVSFDTSTIFSGKDINDGTCYIKPFYKKICQLASNYEYEFTTPTTTTEPPTTTPPPIRCGVWSEAKSNVEELLRRRDHVKFNGRMLRTFDFGGDIMIHASYSQGGYFPIMFNQENPVLELEVCQDANSTCTDSTAMPGIVFSIEFTELPGNPMCFVPEFTESELGNDGACRKATMELTNIESPRQNMQVNFGGKEDYENCNMTLKIKSPGIDKCYMDWNTFYSDINHSEGPMDVGFFYEIGTMTKQEYSNIISDTNSDSQTAEIARRNEKFFKRGESNIKKHKDMNTIDASVEVQPKVGVGLDMGDMGGMGNSLGNGTGVNAKADITTTFKLGYKKEWGSETQNSITYDREDKDIGISRNIYTHGSSHTSTSTSGFSLQKWSRKTLTHKFTVGPGESFTLQQLVISCPYACQETPYHRAFSGERWDPANDLYQRKMINVTQEPDGVTSKNMNRCPSWTIPIVALLLFGFSMRAEVVWAGS